MFLSRTVLVGNRLPVGQYGGNVFIFVRHRCPLTLLFFLPNWNSLKTSRGGRDEPWPRCSDPSRSAVPGSNMANQNKARKYYMGFCVHHDTHKAISKKKKARPSHLITRSMKIPRREICATLIFLPRTSCPRTCAQQIDVALSAVSFEESVSTIFPCLCGAIVCNLRKWATSREFGTHVRR